jgi:hypothetical protein
MVMSRKIKARPQLIAEDVCKPWKRRMSKDTVDEGENVTEMYTLAVYKPESRLSLQLRGRATSAREAERSFHPAVFSVPPIICFAHHLITLKPDYLADQAHAITLLLLCFTCKQHVNDFFYSASASMIATTSKLRVYSFLSLARRRAFCVSTSIRSRAYRSPESVSNQPLDQCSSKSFQQYVSTMYTTFTY